MQYLRDLRTREARALLLKSDLSIADVGGRCGFASSSRFAQAFRSATGLSPREYRAAVRDKRFGALARKGIGATAGERGETAANP